MGERTGARTGTKIERRVEGRESLGTFIVVVEVGRKDVKGGATPTSSQQPQPQDPTPPARPSHHAKDQSPGTGLGRAKERRISEKKNEDSFRRDVGNQGDLGRRRKDVDKKGLVQ